MPSVSYKSNHNLEQGGYFLFLVITMNNNNTNKNAESELRKIIVKYTKKSELEPKNFFVYYEKPIITNNNSCNNKLCIVKPNKNVNTMMDISETLGKLDYATLSEAANTPDKSAHRPLKYADLAQKSFINVLAKMYVLFSLELF